MLSAVPAAAQVSGSISLLSDDRLRGQSVSDGRPAAMMTLSWDSPAGFYANGSATIVATRHDGLRRLSFEENVGYAVRLSSGPTLDLGVSNTDYSRWLTGGYSAHYTEAYVGLASGPISAHIYYSPHYFRRGVSTLYADLDGVLVPAAKWRLTGHIGLLAYTNSAWSVYRSPFYYDWRLGVARRLGPIDVQLSWLGRQQDRNDPGRRYRRSGIVLGATWNF